MPQHVVLLVRGILYEIVQFTICLKLGTVIVQDDTKKFCLLDNVKLDAYRTHFYSDVLNLIFCSLSFSKWLIIVSLNLQFVLIFPQHLLNLLGLLNVPLGVIK